MKGSVVRHKLLLLFNDNSVEKGTGGVTGVQVEMYEYCSVRVMTEKGMPCLLSDANTGFWSDDSRTERYIGTLQISKIAARRRYQEAGWYARLRD